MLFGSQSADEKVVPTGLAGSALGRRLLKSFGAQGLHLGVRTLQQIGLVPILMTFWGQERYENWLVLFATAGFVALLEGGTQAYFGNLLLATWVSGERHAFERALAVTIAVQCLILCGAITLAIIIHLSVDWRAVLGVTNMSERDTAMTLGFLCLGNLAAIPLSTLSAIYKARGNFSRFINYATIILSLETLGVIATVVLGGSMPATAAMFAASVALSGCVLIVDLNRIYPDLCWGISLPDRSEVRSLLRTAPLFFVNSATNVISISVPIIILKTMGGAGAVAAFTICRLLTGILRQVTHQMAHATGAELARQYLRGKSERLKQLFSLSGGMLAVVFGAGAALLFATAQPLLALWTHGAIGLDPILLGVLLAGIYLVLPGQVALTLFYYTNRPAPLSLAHGVYSSVGPALCLFLVPLYGATGAALAMSVPEVIMVGLWLAHAGCVLTGVSTVRFLLTTYGIGLASFIVSYLVARPITQSLSPHNLGDFAIIGLGWLALMAGPAALLLAQAKKMASPPALAPLSIGDKASRG